MGRVGGFSPENVASIWLKFLHLLGVFLVDLGFNGFSKLGILWFLMSSGIGFFFFFIRDFLELFDKPLCLIKDSEPFMLINSWRL